MCNSVVWRLPVLPNTGWVICLQSVAHGQIARRRGCGKFHTVVKRASACVRACACGGERGGTDGERPTHLTRGSAEVWLCEHWLIQPDASCIFHKTLRLMTTRSLAFSHQGSLPRLTPRFVCSSSSPPVCVVARLSALEVAGVTPKPSRTLRWRPRSPARRILRGSRDRRTMEGTWMHHWPGTATNVDCLHQKFTSPHKLKSH